eukprot:symbB.v1.2.003682.t1/scaffold193.1/size400748/1
MSGCGRCSKWQVALYLMNNLPPDIEANTFTFNSIMSACSNGQQWLLAFELLDLARTSGVATDLVTKNCFLAACDKGQKWFLASLVLSQLGEVQHDVFSYNSTLSSLQTASWPLALVCFNGMRPHTTDPDEFSCSLLIGSCDHWAIACKQLDDMPFKGLTWNDVICGASISSLERSSGWQASLEVSESMVLHRVMGNLCTQNAVISALERASRWQDAIVSFFHVRSPDEVSFGACINAYSKGSRWRDALGLLDRMPELSIVPNTVIYNAALDACSSGGIHVMLLFMQAICQEADTVTYNILINACSIEGEWQLAQHFLQQLLENDSTDAISFNSAISACEKSGQWDVALSLLETMFVANIEASEITLSSILSTAVERWEAALSIFSWLTGRKVLPNAIAYNALLAACEAEGRWRWVLNLFDKMQHFNVEADAITGSLAATACLKASLWRKVLHLLGEMELDVYSCKAGITACWLGDDAASAVPLLEEASLLGYSCVSKTAVSSRAEDRGVLRKVDEGAFELHLAHMETRLRAAVTELVEPTVQKMTVLASEVEHLTTCEFSRKKIEPYLSDSDRKKIAMAKITSDQLRDEVDRFLNDLGDVGNITIGTLRVSVEKTLGLADGELKPRQAELVELVRAKLAEQETKETPTKKQRVDQAPSAPGAKEKKEKKVKKEEKKSKKDKKEKKGQKETVEEQDSPEAQEEAAVEPQKKETLEANIAFEDEEGLEALPIEEVDEKPSAPPEPLGTAGTAPVKRLALLTGAEDGGLRFWEDGRCVHILGGHKGAVYGLVVNWESLEAVSAGEDSSKLWNLKLGGCLRTMSDTPEGCLSVCADWDAAKAVVGCGDGTIRLWCLKSGELLEKFPAHRGGVWVPFFFNK